MSVNFGTGITVISNTWVNFKATVIAKSLSMQYLDDSVITTVFAFDGPSLAYSCVIYDGTVPYPVINAGYSQAQNDSDLSDFQTNWLPSANQEAAVSVSTGSLAALNATVQISMSGSQSVGIQIAAGTFIGDILAETSFDNGTTWNQTYFSQVGSGNKNVVLAYSSANTAGAYTFVMNGGVGLARIRAFAYTSGSCNVTLRASNISDESLELFTATPGTTNPPSLAIVGASVTTAAPTYTTSSANALSLNTSGGLRVDGSGVTQPVSGTVAATQSGAWTVQPGNTANTTPWLATINQGGNSAAVKAASTAAVATDPAVVIAVSPNNTVATTAPTLTKGTQGANGWSVQNLKDSGRTSFVAVASATTGVTTEALISLTPVRTVTAGSAGTSLTVTSGKTMRLQALSLSIRNTTTTQAGAIIRLRMNSTTVTATSQVFTAVATTSLNALAGGTNSVNIDLPDGFEISGTTQFGISQLCSTTSCTLDISLIGFEY